MQVHNPHQTDGDTLNDFCDGEDFKSHELFGQNSQGLILHCYFDEFQVTNPLGSKTKRHKLGKQIDIIFLFSINIQNPFNLTILVLNCQILQVHNPHQTDGDTLNNFCDGEDFKSHELFGQNSQGLILHCYFDEFQVTNPLGSKTKRHKLGKQIYYKMSLILQFTVFLSE